MTNEQARALRPGQGQKLSWTEEDESFSSEFGPTVEFVRFEEPEDRPKNVMFFSAQDGSTRPGSRPVILMVKGKDDKVLDFACSCFKAPA